MPRVSTNGVTLSYTREASLGVLPGSPVWKQSEPNNISKFGFGVTRVARQPISKNRQRRKGVLTDLTSSVDFEADATYEFMVDQVDAFLFAKYVGPSRSLPTAVTTSQYTVPAIGTSYFTWGASAAKSLVFARGFTNAANNGLKPITGTVANAATAIPVTGTVAETPAATQSVAVEIAGVRGFTSDLQIDASGNLISTALDFTTLGLSVGQFIHIGGVATANQFANAANLGFARIVSIVANKITLSKKATTFVTDAGTGKAIDILFGSFCANVDVSSGSYQEVSQQFELASPQLMTGPATGFEYAQGNFASTFALNLALNDKAKINVSFIGTDTTLPSASQATGAVNSQAPAASAAISDQTDLARLRMQDVDETGLTTDFKSLVATFNNNVSAEKVLGLLGTKYLNTGIFTVDIQATLIFTNPLVANRIKGNTTVGLDFCVKNGDGGVYFDVPSGELDGGDRSYPVNQSVTLNATLMARKDDTLGYSLSASFFPVLP